MGRPRKGEKSENRSYVDLKKAASLMHSGTYQLIKEAGHMIPKVVFNRRLFWPGIIYPKAKR